MEKQQNQIDLEASKTPLAQKRAVSLEYRPNNAADAPKITATGKGLLAEQIIALAVQHDVPILKNADMAEMLSALNIGDEIPPEAFLAVAQILRYIYHQKGEALPQFPENTPHEKGQSS